MKPHPTLKNVFKDKNRLYTANAVKGKAVYGERLIKQGSNELREWDAFKSKLCAAMQKGIKNVHLNETDIVLYLGASTGTTVSHVSDIVRKGFVFAVEFAPRVCRELVFLAEDRKNIAPLLADANQPGQYKETICQADWLFQDIAQKNQAEIFLKNVDLFLKPGGIAIIAVKARSINVARKPKSIFKEVERKLIEEVNILNKIELDPFQKDHMFYLCKKKT